MRKRFKRLTEKNAYGGYDVKGMQIERTTALLSKAEAMPLTLALNTLGEYEDSGLTAKHVIELAAAEQDGRLVMPPCKGGDTVYFVWPVDCCECAGAAEGCQTMRLKQQGVFTADCPMAIFEIEIEDINVYMDSEETSLEINGVFWFDVTDWKDIKRTRAEAEADLAGMEEKT